MMFNKFMLALGFVVAFVDLAEAAVLVDVKWTRVEVEQAPLQQIHRVPSTTGFRLEGKTITTFSGGGAYKSSGAFGDALETINKQGTHYLKTYTFRNNAITESVGTSGYLQTTVIRTDGVTSCEATTKYRRLPGQKYFTGNRASNNEQMFMSELHAENETCQIRSVDSSQ